MWSYRALVATLLAIVASSAVARPARAFELRDEHEGFSIRVEPGPDERLCVALPVGHDDPASCEGIDVTVARDEDAARPHSGPKVVLVAYVVGDGEVFAVSVLRDELPDTPSREEFSGIQAALTKAYKEVLPTSAHIYVKSERTLDVHGLTVVDVESEVDYPEGSRNRRLFNHVRASYVPIDGGGYSLRLEGANGRRFDALYEQILQSIAVTQPELQDTKGAQTIRTLLRRVGVPAAIWLAVAGVVFGVFILRKRRRAAKAAASAAVPIAAARPPQARPPRDPSDYAPPAGYRPPSRDA